MQPRPWPQVPEQTAQVARSVAAQGPYPLAMRVRDELGELFADAEFAETFGARGRPGWSPGRLALVTVLQFAENLTDRAAAHRVRYGMDFKYALGLDLDGPGFDASVLSEFRARLVEHSLEEKALDLLLSSLRDRGLVKAGGRQRTDSTRVLAAVRDLNRLELAGETLRAALEALACAAPDWLADAVPVREWAERMRGARYRGLPKTHLEHAFAAVALNLLRLDAWCNGHPLDRTRTGHLARLDLSLAASPGIGQQDRWHASPATHGGQVTRVAGGTVNDPAAKTSHEVDVAVHGETDNGRETLLAIGEAKGTTSWGRATSNVYSTFVLSSPRAAPPPTSPGCSATAAPASPTNCATSQRTTPPSS